MSPQQSKRVRNALVRVGGGIASLTGSKPGKRALVFHEVPDVPRFRDFLDWLVAEYEVLALEDWLHAPLGTRTQLTLTFDDGYASWHEAVAPLLEERNLPAVFFVTSGLVGLRGAEARSFAQDRLLRSQELEFISRRQLEELARQPLFEIGGHTSTHPDLGRIGDRSTIREEVASGRAMLEHWLGTEVRWFAYPFGTPDSVPAAARDVVEAEGMSAAFTLIPGWWKPGAGDRFMIGRDGPDAAMPFATWKAWLRGGYDRLYSLRS